MAYAIMSARSLDDLPAFLLIAGAALLPAYLWCIGRARGLPIYPLFALGTLWTFGIPLLAQPASLASYTQSERWSAAVMISFVDFIGTLCWLLPAGRISRPPISYLGFTSNVALRLYLASILAEIVFNLVTSSIDLGLDPALFSILRAVILTWETTGVFVLSFLVGQRVLSRPWLQASALAIVALLISTLPSVLLLVGALLQGGLALIGFALGRGRLPLVGAALLLGGALLLQAGKSTVRAEYWPGIEGAPVTFSRFPGFLADWLTFSVGQVWQGSEESAAHGELGQPPQSLTERASLLPLFLLIQQESRKEPYLHGSTYAIIPGLLVPRLFHEGKARSHLGTYLLAIHYGLQRPEETTKTTIGFGLINEAMANFGWAGGVALGAFVGFLDGGVARWSSAYPMLSFRGFFSVLMLANALQTEYTAGVFLTTLLQGGCALVFFLPLGRKIYLSPLNHPFPSRQDSVNAANRLAPL